MKLEGLENAWLSPEGKYYIDHKKFFTRGAWHENLALCILSDLWGIEDILDVFTKVREVGEYGYVALESLNWILDYKY